jgi:hypothetical protein
VSREPIEDRFDHIRLLAYAMRREGKDPRVVARTRYWRMTPELRSERDWLVVEDDTYEEWLEL